MSDLATTFDAHLQAEFQDLDVDATMATMSESPHVHHVPTITGGNGTDGVRAFYTSHFIGQWPDDTETKEISSTGTRRRCSPRPASWTPTTCR